MSFLSHIVNKNPTIEPNTDNKSKSDLDTSHDSNFDDNSHRTFLNSNYSVPSIVVGFTTRFHCTNYSMGFITRAEMICRCADIANSKSIGLRNSKSIAIN
ncbi:17430_t:CDS:2, partial [Cetraspora pellucida]